MKKFLHHITFIIIFSILFSFTACNNSFSNATPDYTLQNGEKLYNITIHIITDTEVARTAVPYTNPEGLTYTVTATKIPGTGETQSKKDFSDNSCSLELSAGTWNIEVDAQNQTDTIKLSGTETIEVGTDGRYETTVTISFQEKENEKGSVELEFDVTGTEITKLEIKTGFDESEVFNTSLGTSTTDNRKIFPLDINDVPVGKYHPTFTFKDSSDTIISVISGETINVKSGTSTNTWVKTGKALYLEKEENSNIAKFKLTPEIITKMESPIVYVSNSSINQDGSPIHPYSTLNAALKRINALKTEAAKANIDVDYTIKILGSSGTSSESVEINGLNLTIESYDYPQTRLLSSLNIKNSTVSLKNITLKNASNGKTSVTIDDKSTVTFENVTLTGDIESAASLSFIDTTVNGNITTTNTADTSIFNNTSVSGTLSTSQNISVGGNTNFGGGISLNNSSLLQIFITSTLTGNTVTNIIPTLGSYSKDTIIISPSTDYQLTDDDLNAFSWDASNNNRDFELSFSSETPSPDRKIILSNSEFESGSLPTHEIAFTLGMTSYTTNATIDTENDSLSFEETELTVTIKKDNSSYSLADNDSVTLTIYSGDTKKVSKNEFTSGTSLFTISEELPPGTYTLVMSTMIDDISYSSQKIFTVALGEIQ